MSFEFKPCLLQDGTKIEGLYEIQPEVFEDSRGNFLELYSQRDFFAAGLTINFLQDNQSQSVKGVLRGLHFQTRHPQAKLIHAVSGRLYDVALDLRQGSPTFGKYYGVILDSGKQNEFYIPQGFAHGYYVLSEQAILSYKCSDFYDPQGQGGLMWNDPLLNIDWPGLKAGLTPLLSEKDKNHPAFDPNGKYFNIQGEWISE